MERGAATKSQKGSNVNAERRVGECHQWKAIGQCSKGDSCSFSHDRASGNRCDQRQECNRPLLHQKRRHRLTGRNHQKVQASEGTVPLEKEAELRADISSPVCLSYKSESGCKNGANGRSRHAEVDGQPSKKSKKSGEKGSVALLNKSFQLGCVSQDSHPRKSIPRKG